uniref:C-type lectin domain-containing protein n=1 Tax=Anopheles maculatus TaxID=74869 RepID=A0A182T102_9DIPT
MKMMTLKCLCLVLCLALFATDAYAYQQCRLFGGHLASIESEEENARVAAAINAVGDITKDWIIGGSDLGREGNYIWVGLNKKATYLNFNAGEPNNNGGSENCLAMGSAAGSKWNDIPCNYKGAGFVCAFIYL